MSSIHFVLLALAAVAGGYAAMGTRGEPVGWCVGLAHGVLALVALAGFAAARDAGFAVFTAALAVYAGAMCMAEAVWLLRRSPARS